MKKITLWLFTLLCFYQAQAQVSIYGFNQSTTTYTEITGGVVLGTITNDDQRFVDPADLVGGSTTTGVGFPIGFDFTFNSLVFNRLAINSNGWISLGQSALTPSVNNASSSYTPLSSTTTTTPTLLRNTIAAFAADLQGQPNAEIRVETIGVSPNRVLVVQWKNYKRWSTAGDGQFLNFQIRLNETSNIVDVVYGTMTFNTTSSAAQVGLGGTLSTDFNNRTTTANLDWNALAGGSLNSSSCTFVLPLTTPPVSGRVFSWTLPVACTGAPIAGTAVPALTNVCSGGTVPSITVTGNTEFTSGLIYLWEQSTDSGVTWGNTVGGTGATTLIYSPPVFAGTTIQYRLKSSCATDFSNSTVSEVQGAGNPVVQASALNFTNVGLTGLTANWTNGNGNRRFVVISDVSVITDPTNGTGQPALTANAVYSGTGQQIVFDSTGSTVNITGLLCNEIYYFKVYDYLRCGTPTFDYFYNTSSGTNVANVVTPQPVLATLPVENNFTGFTGANLTTVFPGWYEAAIPTIAGNVPANANPTGTTSLWASSTALPSTTAKVNLWLATSNAWIISPKVTLTGASRLSLKAAITAFEVGLSHATGMQGIDDKVTIYVSVDDCGVNWTPVFVFDATNTTALTNVLTDYVIDLSAYTGQTIQIGIQGTDGPIDDVPDYDFHIGNLKIELVPNCESPTNILATSTSATTAVINWTASTSTPANGYEYYVSTSSIAPTVSTPGTIVAAGVLTANITALTPATQYYVWVRSVCTPSDKSPWSTVVSFTTLCLPVTSFIEEFTTWTTGSATAMQNCWSKNNEGSIYATTGGTTPMNGNRLYMFATNPAIAMANLPPVSNLSADTHRLRFLAYATAIDRNLQVGYFDPNDLSSFIAIETIVGLPSTAATAVQYIITPSAIPAGVTQLVFRNKPAAGLSAAIYIDNVIWEAIPTCIEPTDVVMSNVLDTTATVAWVASVTPPANGYEYFYSITNTNPTALTTPSGTVAAGLLTANITGLTPATQYYVWVRAACSVSDKSAWTLSLAFVTPCATFVPTFTESFATFPPACWSRAGAGIPPAGPSGALTGSWFADGFLNVGTTGAIKINLWTTNVIGWIISPIIDMSAGNYRVKFDYGVTDFGNTDASAMGSDDVVKLMATQDNGVTWVELHTFNAASNVSNTTNTFTLELPTYTSATTKFAIFGTSGIVDDIPDYDFFIDNFIVDAIPASAPSCATNLVATPDASCGNFANVLTWTAAAGANGYKLTIGTTTGGNNILDNFIVSALTYSFIGTINTTYYYKLVPFNGIGDATGCVEQSFVTVATGCYCPSVPTSVDGNGITNVLLGTTNFPTTAASYTYHSTPNVTLGQGNTANVQITFATVFTYNTNIWIDFNNNFAFEVSELVYTGESLSTNPTTLNASFAMPAAAALGVHRMRIGTTDSIQTPANPCYSGSWGVTLDFNVNIEVVACLAPSALTATAITTTAATLGWTANGTATAWNVEYGVTGFTQGMGTLVSVTANSHVLSGLTPATTYQFYVQSNCAPVLSTWVGPFSFTTLCDAVNIPFSQDFESATVPNLPLCSTLVNAGTGNNWVTASNPGSGFTTKTLRYSYHATNAANVWYFTRGVNLTAGTTYNIKYKYGNNSTTFIEKLKVSYGASATAVAMTNLIQDHPTVAGATLQNASFDFVAATTGVYYFGFHAYSIADQFNLFVDDILIDLALSSSDFDSANFIAYPNPVNDVLNLSFTSNISKVSVTNLLGQQVLSREVNATTSQIDMSSLPTGTYLVKVVSEENQEKTIKIIKN